MTEPALRLVSDPASSSRLGLVGRDEELEQLSAALGRPPSIVLVEGEAGIGKTRLIREILRDAAGGEVLVGQCHPLPDPFPLAPVIEALQGPIGSLGASVLSNPLLGALRPLFPEASDHLPPPPEPLHDARAERHRLFRAIVEVIQLIDPRVLLFEDVHWSDPATIELLTMITAGLEGGRSLVLTCRPEEVESPRSLAAVTRPRHGVHRVTLSLAPLDRDEVRRLTLAILDTDELSDDFTDYLYERTAGIPFALEELLRLLQDRRDLVRLGDRWSRRAVPELPVPSAIRDSILERVERLAADARRVVRAASVLLVPAGQDLIAQTAGLSAARCEAALSSAIRAALLQDASDGRYSFRHGLARQAVHDAMPGPERRRLHLRAGRALEGSNTPAASLAEHFREAAVAGKAGAYSEAAAEAASALFDDRTATRFLQQALELLPRSSARRSRIAAKLGDAALHGLAHDEAIDVLRRMIDEEGLPPLARGELRFNLGRLLIQAGDAPAGTAEMRAAVPELRRNPALQARTMATLGYPWLREGHLSEHLTWLERAAAVAARVEDRDARMAVLVDRATVLLAVGDPGGWKAVLDIEPEPWSVESARQRMRAAGNLGEASLTLGYTDHARRFAAEGRELAEQHGYARPLGLFAVLDLRIDWSIGRWADLPERGRALLAGDAAPGGVETGTRLVLGLHAAAEGRLSDADQNLRAALELAEDNGGWLELAQAAGALARIALAAGRPRAAMDAVAPAIDLLRGKGVWAWAAEAAPPAVEALLALDSAADAKALVAEMARGLRGKDAPAAKAGLTHARALIAESGGTSEAAARSYGAAERAWRAIHHRYPAARSLEARGRCLSSGSESRGLKLQLDALTAYDDLGAAWDSARLRRSLRRQGLSFGHRRGRKGYGDELSPREAEIIALVTAGKANREIAEALFLSVRTVEAHMARALRKLGVANRRDLARRKD